MNKLTKRELEEPNIEIRTAPRHLIKILSYNVWAEESYWQERIHSVIKNIKDSTPDVACLLDVTQACFDRLMNALESTYILFQVFIEEGNECGMVILCRKETVELPAGTQPYYYDYNVGEGRIIGLELNLRSNGEVINVLCTKLDDHRDNDNIRAEQFQIAHHVIKSLKNLILVGDFNVYSDEEDIEKKISQSKLQDIWITMGCPGKVKYTFDGKKNSCTSDKSQLRATRIYYAGNHLDVKSMGITGTSVISDDVPMPPSCHYGLQACFQSGKRKSEDL